MFGKIPMKLVILTLVLFLAGLTYAVKYSFAGHASPIVDSAEDQIIGYWDERGRDSFLQVTNTSGGAITVHVQVFNFSDTQNPADCIEFNFLDTYTGFDSHIYTIDNLTRNDGVAVFPPPFDDGHGIIAISVVDSTTCVLDANEVLIGTFRVIDLGGNYEYRAVAGGENGSGTADVYSVQYNSTNGRNLSDLVVFHYHDEGGSNCLADQGGIEANQFTMDKLVVDLDENILSCQPPIGIGCPDSGEPFGPSLNFGLNNFFVNSLGGPSLCQDTTTSGVLIFDVDDETEFIGWIGLNDGDGSGSMDIITGIDDDIFGGD